jgi:hypothetical protein
VGEDELGEAGLLAREAEASPIGGLVGDGVVHGDPDPIEASSVGSVGREGE